MKKTLQLEIDLGSWSNSPPKYRKTCPFASTQTLARVDFLRALLWIGVTSIPIQIPRWWLASQWAVLRYVAAAARSIALFSSLEIHVGASLAGNDSTDASSTISNS